MSLWFTNEWFVFPNSIDKKTCNRIKSLGKGKWTEAGVHHGAVGLSGGKYTPEERLTGRQSRISDIYWTDEQWLYDLIWPVMLEANKVSGWNLDISAAESMQIGRYQKGGFYAWHKDGSSDSLSAYDNPENKFLHGKVRKLSLSLVLNDDFEGGDLEFASYGREKCIITPVKARKGDMIFFTSGMEHRVAPVTKGVRYSLVNWFVGPPVR